MIYIIDHKDSFTHNVVHQFENFDKVECDNFNEINKKNFEEVARMMIVEAMPFYKLWVEIETNYTSGDGYLDKLCMELVGLPSSRCRPPTRDMREKYRQKTLDYMKKIKVPHLKF